MTVPMEGFWWANLRLVLLLSVREVALRPDAAFADFFFVLVSFPPLLTLFFLPAADRETAPFLPTVHPSSSDTICTGDGSRGALGRPRVASQEKLISFKRSRRSSKSFPALCVLRCLWTQFASWGLSRYLRGTLQCPFSCWYFDSSEQRFSQSVSWDHLNPNATRRAIRSSGSFSSFLRARCVIVQFPSWGLPG